MTNRKRTTLISVLIIALCLSVCIGATYAYFTDSVESKGNIIKSGTLDVTMEYANGTTDPTNTTWTDASTGAIFNYDLWEPGYTEVYHIKIENKGTLALKYRIVIVPTGEISTTTVDGEVISLADVIDVYYADPAIQVASRDVLTDESKLGTLTAAIAGMGDTATGNLKAGESHTITIALKMQEDAGNKYQNLSIGTDFAIQLHATQYTYESDAFDENYDADAEIPCDHPETEVIEGYAATCTATGLTDGEYCTTCRKMMVEQQTISENGHTAGVWVVDVEPTVDTEGTKHTQCTVCGDVMEESMTWEDPGYLMFELSDDRTYYIVTGLSDETVTTVAIPHTYNGISVTSVGDLAFLYTKITSVTIPDSITSIGKSAFYGCYVTSVAVPDSVTSIGDYVFYDSRLQSISIPDSITSIGKDVFGWCLSLSSITFGGTVAKWQSMDVINFSEEEMHNYTVYCTDGTIDQDGNVTYYNSDN